MQNSPMQLKLFWEIPFVGFCLWNVSMSYFIKDAAFLSIFKFFFQVYFILVLEQRNPIWLWLPKESKLGVSNHVFI